MTRPVSITIQICGAGLAFAGFSMSLIIGLYVDNTFTTVVLRALAVMVLAYLLGIFLAWLGHKAIEENFKSEVDKQQQENETVAEEMENIKQELANENESSAASATGGGDVEPNQTDQPEPVNVS